jgi:hypothetical protein
VLVWLLGLAQLHDMALRCASVATRAPHAASACPPLDRRRLCMGGVGAGPASGEVAAVHTSANASVIAGLGYTGIPVSFVARHNPWAIPPVALLLAASPRGSLPQRRLGLPDASVLVLQGFALS